MKGKLLFVIALSLLLAGLTTPAAAQSETSGSIVGTVVDAEGGALPGATVTATSDALVSGRAEAITDARGNYRFPSLPPGVYAVEARLSGFKTVRQEGVRVVVGQTLAVKLTMALATVTEEITVIAESPQVSTVSNVVADTLGEEYFLRQPLSRSVNALMNYAPTVSGMHAFGGTQRAANAYTLDGVDVSDPGSGDYWLLPSIDWLKEVQITGLGADAEYGGYTGGVFNLVTKSGGNLFAGDASVFYSGGGLVSNNTPSNASIDLQPTKKDSDWDVSLSVGGPVVRDRVWFYLSGEEVRVDETPFQPAEIIPFESRRNTKTRLSRYMGKLTYQIDRANRVVALLDYDGKFQEHRGVDYNTLYSAAQKQESPNTAYSLSWEGLLSESNFLTAKLTGFSGRDDRLPYAGDTPGRYDAETGYEWQNYRYTSKYKPQRMGLDLAWSLYADGLFSPGDSHTFKFGADVTRAKHDETRVRNGGFTYYDDSYYCSSLEEYFADPFCGVYSSDLGNEIFLHSKQKELSLYAQDSMRLDRVTLNYGLRYTQYKAGFKNTADDVYDVGMIAPRLGFVWDVLGNGRSALKAHYGRYYEGLYTYMYDRDAEAGAFTPYRYCDYNFRTDAFDKCGILSTNSAALDPNIKHPYVDELLFTFERQTGRETAVGLDYAHRKTKDIITFSNVNDDYEALIAPDDPLTGGGLPFYDLQTPPVYMLTNQPAAVRRYDMVTLRFDKRYADGWTLRASLAWQDLKGNTYAEDSYTSEWDDLNGQTNAYGRLPGYSEWELKISGSVDLPWGVVASGYYRFESGEYWTPRVQIRGLYENDRTYAFMEKRGSEQLGDRNVVDLHLAKSFDVSGLKLTLMVDAFNVFNSNTVLDLVTTWGRYYYDYPDPPSADGWDGPRGGYKDPLAIESPREIRFGVRLSF